MGAIVRAGLLALELAGEVYKVRASDAVELAKLVRSLRRGKLGMVSLSGALCAEAPRMADELGPSARHSGYADMLMGTPSGVFGHDTTYDAFLETLGTVPVPRSTAVVVGAGASAFAAVAACRQLGFQFIGITSRSWLSTEVLHDSSAAAKLRTLGALPTLWPSPTASPTSRFSQEMRLQFLELAASAQVIIQTVPVAPSSKDARLLTRVVSWSQTRSDAIVCDLVYGGPPSPFLVEARRHGLTGIGGVEMLTTRGLRMLETWTGMRPPPEPIHAAALRACARSRDE
jgi:shikimate dehydrogenase